MRRSQGLGFILLVITIFFSLQPSYADPPLPTPVGRVVWIKGTLKAVMPNKEIRLLQKLSVIYLRDTLTTDAVSQAQVIFTDNTLMTFRPSTQFYINQYNYNPSSKKKSIGKYIMNLIEGGFRTITGLIAKNNPDDYQVNTPVATIGVRGTDYSVYIENGQLYVGYLSGVPCIHDKGGTLCLSKETPYARVPTADAAPVPLTEQPVGFKEQLTIIPAKISPFGVPSGSNGPITSFCISQ